MDAQAPSRSAAKLVLDAIDHISALIRNEAALLKAEMTEKALRAQSGAVLVIVGVVLAIPAALALMAAAVLGLIAAGLAPVWAALIVGATLSLLALIAVALGVASFRKALSAPTTTLRNVRKDIETIKETTHVG